MWATAVVAIIGGGILAAMALPGKPSAFGSPPPTTHSTPSARPTPTPLASVAPSVPHVMMSETGVPVTVIGRLTDGRFAVTTPCGRRETIAGGASLDGVTVIIDPGHGGEVDTGAVQNGIVEADLNLAVAEAMAAELRSRGVGVALTRTFDYGTTLATRAGLADALGARALVSIHHNSSGSVPPTSTRPGTEVFVQRTVASQRLGGLVYEAVSTALRSTYAVTWYRTPDAGVLRVTQPDGQETYGMIRHPATTTALVEIGWLLNPVEAADVFSAPTYVPVAASALADAVEAYLAGTPSEVAVGRRSFTARRAPGTDRCTDPALER